MAAKRNPKELADILKRQRKPVPPASEASEGHSVSELGLSADEINHLYFKFQSFREGWDAPGMETYDNL